MIVTRYSSITTDVFEEQLVAIVSYYLENESPQRADKVAQSISETVQRIKENPLQFPIYEKAKDCRKAVVHDTFIILFKVIETQIFVFDIYHGKRK